MNYIIIILGLITIVVKAILEFKKFKLLLKASDKDARRVIKYESVKRFKSWRKLMADMDSSDDL